MIKERSECMKRWLMVLVVLSYLGNMPSALAEEIHYGYYEEDEIIPLAVAPEALSPEAKRLFLELQPLMAQRETMISLTYKGEWEKVLSDFRAALSATLREDEYLAYDYMGYGLSYKGDTGRVTLLFQPRYIQTAEQVAFVKQRIKTILPTIVTPQMDDYAKVKAVHDYVVLNVAYDPRVNQDVNAPYFALTGGKTLCNGYAMLVHQMLEELTIPVRLISGDAGNGHKTEHHAWNLVQLGGKWFHLDATWNDPLPDVKGRVLYNYYLLTDQEIAKDHFWSNGGLNNHDASYPRATTELFTHLAATGRLDVVAAMTNGVPIAADEQALTTYVQQQFARHTPSFDVLYQGKRSAGDIIIRSMDGNQQGVSYSYRTHRMPNTTEITVTVKGYKGQPLPPKVTELMWVAALPAEVVLGTQQPLRVTALYDDGTSKDVTAQVAWQVRGATRTNDTLHFSQPGVAEIAASFEGQALHYQVEVVKPLALMSYPIAGVKPLQAMANIPATKVWTVTLSNPAISVSGVYVLDKYGQRVTTTIVNQGTSLTISPATPYQAGETYYLMLDDVASTHHKLVPQSMKFTIAR